MPLKEREGQPLYCPLVKIATLEKKAPVLQHVNAPLVQVLHPEQVEVEVCHSEELERRRGLTSELDEM